LNQHSLFSVVNNLSRTGRKTGECYKKPSYDVKPEEVVMKLYLQQHGEVCTKEVDPERPLTDKGQQDIDRLAGFLAASGVRVARVMHSGKLRAAQTAARMAESVAPAIEVETSDQLAPNDDPKRFDLPGKGTNADVLVVGHLPFMVRLVSYLLVGDEDLSLLSFQPGTVVCLEQDTDDHWQLRWMMPPGLVSQQAGE
jgi:phosphohistidine phosphatase